jgi:predicted nucleic acid-binding protein
MADFVVDCSAAAKWLFADEASPAADALLDRLARDRAVVPGHWPLEMANVIAGAERRRRVARADAEAFVRHLGRLAIDVDGETPHRALRECLALARAEGLTSYDAAYLELALRRRLPLATADAALARAARKQGVGVIAV